jgi:hypothetical protein
VFFKYATWVKYAKPPGEACHLLTIAVLHINFSSFFKEVDFTFPRGAEIETAFVIFPTLEVIANVRSVGDIGHDSLLISQET